MSSESITREDVGIALRMAGDYLNEISSYIYSMNGDESDEWKPRPEWRGAEVNALDEGALDGFRRVIQRLAKHFKETDETAVQLACRVLENYLEDLKESRERSGLKGLLALSWEESEKFTARVLEALKNGKIVATRKKK